MSQNHDIVWMYVARDGELKSENNDDDDDEEETPPEIDDRICVTDESQNEIEA